MEQTTTYNLKESKSKKFGLYLAIVSMIMMFSALFSALLVKRGDSIHWVKVDLPNIFIISSFIVILSSLTLRLAKNELKYDSRLLFFFFNFITLILGIIFLGFQLYGWAELNGNGFNLQANPSSSFIYVISGLHAFHYIFGILSIIFLMIYIYYKERYSNIEYNNRYLHFDILSTYWDFIGILWIVIYLFFKFIIYNQ